MQLSGFIKQSLIDYPGMIAAVVFTQGCNLNCPYCHNPQLISSTAGTIPVSETLRYFTKNRLLLDAVVITGGEPTLQKDLPQYLSAIKQLGLKVKLDTNGVTPDILSRRLSSGLIDYVAMDIKSELTPAAYSRASGVVFTKEAAGRIRQSARLIIDSGIPHEFRTTVCRELVTPENIRALLQELDGARQYFLQQYRPPAQQRPASRQLSPCSTEEMAALAQSLNVKWR